MQYLNAIIIPQYVHMKFKTTNSVSGLLYLRYTLEMWLDLQKEVLYKHPMFQLLED